MRIVRLLGILLLLTLAAPQPGRAAAPLHLEASTARSEFTEGDSFVIAAHLFNDGRDSITGDITITAPVGFAAQGLESTAGQIAPGRALSLASGYRVAGAPLGLARFVVRGGGQVRVVVIRIGPIEAPPARPPIHKIYLPALL